MLRWLKRLNNSFIKIILFFVYFLGVGISRIIKSLLREDFGQGTYFKSGKRNMANLKKDYFTSPY